MQKNKNLLTLSLPSEYHEKIRELGYTRKILSEIIKERLDEDIQLKAYKEDEQRKKEIRIIRDTKWMED